MRFVILATALALMAACAQVPSTPQAAIPSLDAAQYAPPPVQQLTARTLRVFETPEADQGVAADRRFIYPVDNFVIGKYRRDTGEIVARWVGEKSGLIRHLNSCFEEAGKLWCANSNYPQAPMGSSVEIFDAASMRHMSSHSFGMMDEGSLTWFGRYQGGWIASFTHYDGNGVGFKNHAFSNVVTFDAEWRKTGGWLFPASAMERMAPYGSSGGQLGPDGLLYILGHDRPEMYVLARPTMGPVLIHLATISLEVEGQAFTFDPASPRSVFAIDRRKGLTREIDLPRVTLDHPYARAFR